MYSQRMCGSHIHSKKLVMISISYFDEKCEKNYKNFLIHAKGPAEIVPLNCTTVFKEKGLKEVYFQQTK